MAPSVKCVTAAQVMILRFVGSSPAPGSVRTAWSLLRILSPSLSAPSPSRSVSLGLSKINKCFKKKKERKKENEREREREREEKKKRNTLTMCLEKFEFLPVYTYPAV